MAVSDGIDASRLGIAGYSFGAAVAIAAAARSNLAQALVSIACPSRVFNEMSAQKLLLPKLLILGEHDHDFPAQQFRFMARRFTDPKDVEIIRGADHFFGGHVGRGCAAYDRFLRELAGRRAGAAAVIRQTAIAFKSKRVTLEGVLAMPEDLPQPFPAIVMCHPHPLLGGNMDTPVVASVCRAASEAGFASFRFNFRGVEAVKATSRTAKPLTRTSRQR